MTSFPLPGSAEPLVAVPAPGTGVGFWAGSSSAVLDDDGSFVVAYRVRAGEHGRGSNVIARSEDGVRFTTIGTIDQERFGAQSMESPAIVRTDGGRWRLYVCPASPAPSKHWWIDVLEADEPEGLAGAEPRTASGATRTPASRTRSCGAPRTDVGGMDLLPPARRAGRGGPDDDGVRHEPGRPRVGVARHRARAAARDVGRTRREAHRRPARRPRRLRRARDKGGELVRAHRPGASHRQPAGRAGQTTTTPPPTPATSTSCRFPAAATGSTTRHVFRTRATSSAPSSSRLSRESSR